MRTHFYSIILVALLISCSDLNENKDLPEQIEFSSGRIDPIIFRTDFSSDENWHQIIKLIESIYEEENFEPKLDFREDEKFGHVSINDLFKELDEQYKDQFNFYFVYDSLSLADSSILCIKIPDKYDPGADQFRTVPTAVFDIEGNLRIANMGFAEFSQNVDEMGIYRGLR